MNREGFRSDANLTDKFDDLLNDQSIDRTDLVQILDVLSEKLKLLETKQETSNLNQRIAPSETALDALTCNFKHTCYTARFNMGSCPCELYQQEK